MRARLLVAAASFCLAACGQSNQSLLTSGAWNCVASDEIHMDLSFGNDGKLFGKIKLADPSLPPDPESIAVSLDAGGSWKLDGESNLSFRFSDVKVTEGKRGSQALDPGERDYFKRMFETTADVRAKITSISGSKLVLEQDDKDAPLSCTR